MRVSPAGHELLTQLAEAVAKDGLPVPNQSQVARATLAIALTDLNVRKRIVDRLKKEQEA